MPTPKITKMKEEKQHKCNMPKDTKMEGYGIAINYCWEEDGELWVTNEEYSNTVRFCPFCGFTLKKTNYVDSMTPEEREEQRKIQESAVLTTSSTPPDTTEEATTLDEKDNH